MGGASLEQLQERRAYECRLVPQRALESLSEAHDFLIARGMLTRTADSALPSLFGACHEEPYLAGGSGFGAWPATKYPWFWELAQHDRVFELSIHGGKSILLSDAVAAIVDPICRAELERHESAGGDPAQLLRHLVEVGPSELADVKLELGWSASRLRKARAPLQTAGALVSHGVTLPTQPGGHVHTSVLARWDQVFPEASGHGGLEDLIVAGVRAAVVAPEDELNSWFSWHSRGTPTLADRLVNSGRLRRPQPGWVACADAG
jgi:hypothetical protein